jgi:broad specificity phosphatase PhoE
LLKDELPHIYSSNASFKRVFETATLRWAAGGFAAQGVETWEELKERVVRAIETIMKELGRAKAVAVFTSGGAISASVSHVLGLSGENAMRLNWQIVNTSVTRFLYDDERMTLAGFNSIAHLELLREPSLITYR